MKFLLKKNGFINKIKNHLMKKVYTLLLAIILSMPAMMADDYVDSNGLKFVINVNTSKAGFNGVDADHMNLMTDIVVPDYINYNGKDYPVMEVLTGACYNNPKLKSIKFGNQMLRIGSQTFYNCKALEKVEFGANVHTISSMAFYGCSSLNNLVLPPDMDTLGDFAFYKCTGLTGTINIPASTLVIAYNPFAACTGISGYTVDEGCRRFKALDGVLFNSDCTTLISYPLGLKDANGKYVTSYTLPSTVKTIGSNAMRDNARLETVVFNEGLETIGDQAFNLCSLKEVNLPASLTAMGDRVFSGCRNITKFTVAESNPNFSSRGGMLCSKDGKTLICGVGTSAVVIPDGVEIIERYSFYNLFTINTLNLNGVKYVGEASFYNCPGLKEINLGNALEEIGAKAFMQCSQFSKLDLPSTLKKIGDASFSMCFGLKTVKFNEGLEEIGANAFMQNISLEEVSLPSSIKTMGNGIFVNCQGLQRASLAEGITATGQNMFTQCSSLVEVKLPSTLKTIEDLTFLNTGFLEDLDFPRGLTKIGEGAFQYSGLSGEITLPDACEEIGHAAFTYCANMTAFTAGKGLRTIGENGLGANQNLAKINLNEGLTSIGYLAFGHLPALKTIIIPSTVTTIGDHIFGETKNLLEIENRAVNPQPLGNTLFYYREQYQYVKLRVPAESVDKYKTAKEWKEFRVIEGSAAGLNDLESSDAEIVEIYDLGGHRHENLIKGVNIVKMSDGTVRKVVSRD